MDADGSAKTAASDTARRSGRHTSVPARFVSIEDDTAPTRGRSGSRGRGRGRGGGRGRGAGRGRGRAGRRRHIINNRESQVARRRDGSPSTQERRLKPKRSGARQRSESLQEQRRIANRERTAARRRRESPSTRERRLAADRERMAARRQAESPSTRERRLVANRERVAARRRGEVYSSVKRSLTDDHGRTGGPLRAKPPPKRDQMPPEGQNESLSSHEWRCAAKIGGHDVTLKDEYAWTQDPGRTVVTRQVQLAPGRHHMASGKQDESSSPQEWRFTAKISGHGVVVKDEYAWTGDGNLVAELVTEHDTQAARDEPMSTQDRPLAGDVDGQAATVQALTPAERCLQAAKQRHCEPSLTQEHSPALDRDRTAAAGAAPD